jgi:hypothetical protein
MKIYLLFSKIPENLPRTNTNSKIRIDPIIKTEIKSTILNTGRIEKERPKSF